MQRDQLIKTLRSLRPDLEAQGVTHLALFGSRARGDHRSNSDIDLLVEVDDSLMFSLLDLIGVQHIIGDKTGLEANAMMRRSLDRGFRDAIKNEIVSVF